MIGRISYWNDDRGYGFLKPDNPSETDCFVHHIAFTKAGIDFPVRWKRDVLYEFDVESIQNGRTRATNLRIIEPPATDSE